VEQAQQEQQEQHENQHEQQGLLLRLLIENVAVSQPGQVSMQVGESGNESTQQQQQQHEQEQQHEHSGHHDVVVEAVAFPLWPRPAPLARELLQRLTTSTSRTSNDTTLLPNLTTVKLFEDAGCHLMGEQALWRWKQQHPFKQEGEEQDEKVSKKPEGDEQEVWQEEHQEKEELKEDEVKTQHVTESRVKEGFVSSALCGLEFSSSSPSPSSLSAAIPNANAAATILVCVGTGVGTAVEVCGKLVGGAQGLIEGGHIVCCSSSSTSSSCLLPAPTTTSTPTTAPATATCAVVAPRQCGCGQLGCVEAHASGPAITAIANTILLEKLLLLFSCRDGGDKSGSGGTGGGSGGNDGGSSSGGNVEKEALLPDDPTRFLFPDCEAVFAAAWQETSGGGRSDTGAVSAGSETMTATMIATTMARRAQVEACQHEAAIRAVHHAALVLARMCLALARAHDPISFVFSGGVFNSEVGAGGGAGGGSGASNAAKGKGEHDGKGTGGGTEGGTGGGKERGKEQGRFLALVESQFRSLNWKVGDHASLPLFRTSLAPHSSALFGAVALATTH
jgi:predicted NBD/HSP70 family sugar kinase